MNFKFVIKKEKGVIFFLEIVLDLIIMEGSQKDLLMRKFEFFESLFWMEERELNLVYFYFFLKLN